MSLEQKILLQAEEHIKEHNFIKALEMLDKYLSIPHTGICIKLLNMYIDCQIKLGLFDEAVKNIELMNKYFSKIKPYDLALKYAACCQEEKLKDILDNYSFSPKQYYKIAQYCLTNENVDLAEILFKLVCTYSDEELIELSKQKLKIIANYKIYGDKIFRDKTYSCFRYYKNKLMPGHIIMTCRLRDDYPENIEYKKVNWPYMIWRIEGKKIYAFPVVEKLDKFRYVFPKENYPGRNDRTLKDRLFCIHEDDVTTVIDKITDTDYEKSINSMYLNLIHTQKGVWQPETSYFMTTFLKDNPFEIGDVIVIFNNRLNTMSYYFIFNMDEYNYYTYEVSYKFLPFTNDIKVHQIPKNTTQASILKLADPSRKELLLSLAPQIDSPKRILKP